jgi:hypothetical protein
LVVLVHGASRKIERRERARKLSDLFVLAHRLLDGIGVPAARLVEGLEAPVRRVGTAKALDAITQRPGIKQDALTVLLRLPDWYVTELTLRLKAIGAINLGLGGWQATAEPDDRRS